MDWDEQLLCLGPAIPGRGGDVRRCMWCKRDGVYSRCEDGFLNAREPRIITGFDDEVLVLQGSRTAGEEDPVNKSVNVYEGVVGSDDLPVRTGRVDVFPDDPHVTRPRGTGDGRVLEVEVGMVVGEVGGISSEGTAQGAISIVRRHSNVRKSGQGWFCLWIMVSGIRNEEFERKRREGKDRGGRSSVIYLPPTAHRLPAHAACQRHLPAR